MGERGVLITRCKVIVVYFIFYLLFKLACLPKHHMLENI